MDRVTSGSSRLRRLLVPACAAALVVALAPAAAAHAAYKSSNPADESTVSSPPSQITAEFTEPITENSYLQVYDPCGQRVDNGDSQVSGYNMSVTMSADKAGGYVVEFAAQSIDSHITYGSFSFTSSGGAPCPGDEPPPTEQPGGGGGGGGDPQPGAPEGPGGSGGAEVADGMGAGAAAGSRGAGPGKHARHTGEGDGARAAGGRAGGPKKPATLAFQRTREDDREPAPWDLPFGGAVMALVLCVMIGAAGGRVYASIVGPARR